MQNFSNFGNFSQYLKFDAELDSTVGWQVQVQYYITV